MSTCARVATVSATRSVLHTTSSVLYTAGPAPRATRLAPLRPGRRGARGQPTSPSAAAMASGVKPSSFTTCPGTVGFSVRAYRRL